MKTKIALLASVLALSACFPFIGGGCNRDLDQRRVQSAEDMAYRYGASIVIVSYDASRNVAKLRSYDNKNRLSASTSVPLSCSN